MVQPWKATVAPRLRGMCKVALEWSLVTLAYNFRRLARLIPAATTRCHGDFALQTAQEPTKQGLSPTVS